MSVSGKKDFDVKQILRLRWRWFSHSSQGSAGGGGGGGGGVGGYIQQDGLDHRGPAVQGRLKSHSRERGVGGLRKTNSPVHGILAPTPGPTPVYVRAGQQSWHLQQNTIQGLQVNQESSKSSPSPNTPRKEDATTGQEDVKNSTVEPAEMEARERYDCRQSPCMLG
ncbi:klhl4 [Pungitius sinensis]